MPDIQAAGVTLAPGDKFTAGDYTVVITEITSGDPAGYKGTGYVEMKLVAGIIAKKIAVDFTNLVVNECYEMASGEVQTQYDPNWGNVIDVDAGIDDVKSIIDKLTGKIENYDGTESSKQEICEGLNNVMQEITNNNEFTETQKENGIFFLNKSIEIFNSSCFTCNNAAFGGRLSSTKLGECKLDEFKAEYTNFTSSIQNSKCNCTPDKSQLPSLSTVKNGARRILICTENAQSPAPTPCKEVFYAFTGLSSSKLNNRNAASNVPSKPIGWLTEGEYIQQYLELFKAIGDITGTFFSVANRQNTILKESAAIVEEFFTQHPESQFDPEFLKLAGIQKDKYVQSANFKVSGTVTPIYLKYEILSLGTITMWKNIATKFSTKAFRLAFEISTAKIIEKKTKKEIAEIVAKKIVTKTPAPKNFKVKVVVKDEVVDNVQLPTSLIVEGTPNQVGSLGSSSTQFTDWETVLKNAIPDITSIYKRTWATNSVNSGKISVSNEIKNAIIEAADIADNNLYGDRV
ncbi:hypothetical protein [Lacihabitans sp. LS3-19]|uniref:hypothetical protein n=1 Tax=Lacihabitans sp. LS3-19 TaxID=2487335 RepID=UPI0020CD2D50|nr:hypothetical protein [Lacihabitans sp. LS3-19]